jgi:asparaginyl-tRNA synthetase
VIAKLVGIVDSQFARVDYIEAISILERAKQNFEFPVSWCIDLQSERERYLTEKHAGRPVIVTNYPKAIKAFYMRVNDDGRMVAAMDVVAPGIGEIIGGSQREERLDVLDARMAETGLDPAHYGWYRDLRRYGTMPHAGFGLGFERTVAYVTGLANVRDVIPFEVSASEGPRRRVKSAPAAPEWSPLAQRYRTIGRCNDRRRAEARDDAIAQRRAPHR